MAIKVIKEGTKKPKVFRVECNECGCVFEYDKNDIFVYEAIPGCTIYDTELCKFAVRCPQCNNECVHNE